MTRAESSFRRQRAWWENLREGFVGGVAGIYLVHGSQCVLPPGQLTGQVDSVNNTKSRGLLEMSN